MTDESDSDEVVATKADVSRRERILRRFSSDSVL